MNHRTRPAIAAILCAALLISCLDRSPKIYVADIPGFTWDRSQPAYIYVDNSDTLSLKDISVIVRHGDSYPYNKIILSIETLAPDKTFTRDTISIGLPKTGSTAYADTETKFRTNVKFGQTGIYRFRMSQIMPDSLLTGISGVGIKLSR